VSQAVLYQGTATFSVSASSETSMTYQWYFDGTAISGATSSSYTIADAQTSNAGSYWVQIVNGGGSVTSSTATLTVNVPPTIIIPPQSQTVTQGQSASFSVTASGTTPLSYQWYLNGSALSGATSSGLGLNSVQTTQAGSYSVMVSNVAGTVTSGAATLTVNVPPTITTQPQNQTVIQGQSASFSVAASGTTPLSYQWYFNGTAMSGATSSGLSLTNVQTAQAGSYSVVVSNVAGTVTSGTATLTVNVPPTITTQPQNQTVTQGQSASFSVAASGTTPLSYQWYFNGTALSGATSSGLSLTNVQTAQAGSYSVMVSNVAGTVTSAAATLTVNVPPTITAQPQNQTAIKGQSASFSVAASGTTPLSYQWYFNGTALSGATSSGLSLSNVQSNNIGSYSVVVSNIAGSVTSSTATLTVYFPPGITGQPQDQAVTQGQIATFAVTAKGSKPLNYQWYCNGAALSDATDSTLALSNVQTTLAGSYTVTVSNVAGSASSSAAMLTVYVPPSITSQPQSQAVAAGQNVTFAVSASGTTPLACQWYFNGTALAGSGSSELTLSNVQTSVAGSYSVVVTNIAGSVSSQPATLTVTNTDVVLSVPAGTGLDTNGFTFQMSVPNGSTYVILASSDCQNWAPIATNVASSGTVTFTDPAALSFTNRYYQAVVTNPGP
jgi:hypothetical protein